MFSFENFQEQTLDLMYCDPKPDPSGRIAAQPWGGKRRIDKIVYDKECSSVRTPVFPYIIV